MATIITRDYVKDYLNIAHTEHDGLLDQLMDDAEGRLQQYLRRPIVADTHTEYLDGGSERLFLTNHPVGSITSITDTKGTNTVTDDEALSTDLYRLESEMGIVYRTTANGAASCWGAGRQRWKIIYTGGLDVGSYWTSYEIDALRASLRDLVATWYNDRSPESKSQQFGGGMGQTNYEGELPPRVRSVWDHFVEPVFGAI